MLKQERKRFALSLSAGILAILVGAYFSLTNGTYPMTAADLWDTLFRGHSNPELGLILFEFRLPRLIVGALVGLGLAIAGTVIQAISKNGLADPGILGINSGAGLGVVIFMYAFMGNRTLDGYFSAISMPLFGLTGGIVAALLIFGLAWERGRLDSQRLLLFGIAVGTGLGSGSIYLSLRMKSGDFDMAAVWVAGSIWNANWYFMIAMVPWFLLLLPIILFKAKLLDVFQLTEESIKSLGVRTEKQKLVLLFASVSLVAICVAAAGAIGFVGLIAPHIAKQLVGQKHMYVLPISGMIGMLLVILADLLARVVVAPAEIPAGIVVSIIGVPYFIYLLFRARA